MYPAILATLAGVERVQGAASRFGEARPLGVLAVRELDGAGGDQERLAEAVFSLLQALRVEAGLPPYA
jgi:hypothetical protein